MLSGYRCIYKVLLYFNECNVIQKGVHTYKLAGLCWDLLSGKNSDSCDEYSNSIETIIVGENAMRIRENQN